MLSLLFYDLPLQILYFVIDTLAGVCFSFNFFNQLLDLELLCICCFLSDILLLLLLVHLHFMHLKFFKQLIIFHLQVAHLVVLLAELGRK